MAGENNKRTKSIIGIVIVLIVFIGIFQGYMAFEKKSYKYSEELLANSYSVVEVSMEDDEDTYYVRDEQVIFKLLEKGLHAAIFKPTKQTPKNPQYIIRIYNESLQVETTITVFPNNQMQVNGDIYNVEEADLSAFEEALFKETYEVKMETFNDFATYMYEKVIEEGTFAEENQQWAEIIAVSRIAQEMEVDLTGIDLLMYAPTKEVAEQLIAYGVAGYNDYGFLIQAVIQERVEVAEVLLESGTGTDPSNRIIGEPSPIVIAKLNEDDEMVDLLLNYEFEDEYVDPKHIEQAQNVVVFKGKDAEEVITDLERGVLPGVDFQIPTTSKEIKKVWGDYTGDEEDPTLSYNRHMFWRAIDLYKDRKDEKYNDIHAYTYQFIAGEKMRTADILEILGEPADRNINEGIFELLYEFGDYRLNLIVDSEGYVWNMTYMYENIENGYEP